MKATKRKDQQKTEKSPAKPAGNEDDARVTRSHKYVLQFTPTAWAKLAYFCHRGDTEVGGFGITSPDDPLRIEDFQTVDQCVSWASVEFGDEAVADYVEDQVDLGRRPENFLRIWLHTHPGTSPTPSGTDEETFDRVFGRCDWAVMFILARRGQTYARLRFNAGLQGELLIPVEIDYRQAFSGTDYDGWEEEYEANVHPETLVTSAMREISMTGRRTASFDGSLDPESAHLAGWPYIDGADEDFIGADGEEEEFIDLDLNYWLHEYPSGEMDEDLDPNDEEEEPCQLTPTDR